MTPTTRLRGTVKGVGLAGRSAERDLGFCGDDTKHESLEGALVSGATAADRLLPRSAVPV